MRKLCLVRNQLIRAFPSTVQEIRFFVAHEKSFRHGLWKLLAGGWLYWFMGNCFTKRPRLLTRAQMNREEPIVDTSLLDGGFEYSDAYLHDNDARFVWLFIRAALDHGCAGANYVESLASAREQDGWRVQARDSSRGGRSRSAQRPSSMPAALMPTSRTRGRTSILPTSTSYPRVSIYWSKRLTPHKRVLTFFADDGRLFFVIPMGPCTCIGTTDTKGTPRLQVTPEDRRFVLDNINKRLKLARRSGEGHHRRALRRAAAGGGRALRRRKGLDAALAQARVETDPNAKHLTIFGGKLTDCLNVGEEVCAIVSKLGIPIPRARAALVRRAGGGARGVVPPGQADRSGCADLARLVGEAVDAALAPLRRRRLLLFDDRLRPRRRTC